MRRIWFDRGRMERIPLGDFVHLHTLYSLLDGAPVHRLDLVLATPS